MEREHLNRWAVPVILATTCSQIAGCGADTVGYNKIEPARVEQIEGSKLSRVILTQKAMERLGVETEPVRDTEAAVEGDSVGKLNVIPYSAVLYGVNGETWTYTSPKSQSFVRHHIEIDRIDGDLAILLEGPPVGTTVVSVGVMELYGTEIGIDD